MAATALEAALQSATSLSIQLCHHVHTTRGANPKLRELEMQVEEFIHLLYLEVSASAPGEVLGASGERR